MNVLVLAVSSKEHLIANGENNTCPRNRQQRFPCAVFSSAGKIEILGIADRFTFLLLIWPIGLTKAFHKLNQIHTFILEVCLLRKVDWNIEKLHKVSKDGAIEESSSGTKEIRLRTQQNRQSL